MIFELYRTQLQLPNKFNIFRTTIKTRAKKKTSYHCNLLKPIVQVCTLSRNAISSITLKKKFELNRSQSGKSINDQTLPRMAQTNTSLFFINNYPSVFLLFHLRERGGGEDGTHFELYRSRKLSPEKFGYKN